MNSFKKISFILWIFSDIASIKANSKNLFYENF